jgi:hypothetical protein
MPRDPPRRAAKRALRRAYRLRRPFKVRELKPEISTRHTVILFGGRNGERLLNLCGCCESDELAALSHEDIEDTFANEVERFAMEASKIKTQASRINNRVQCGLKRQIDNLIESACSPRPSRRLYRWYSSQRGDDDDL